MTQLLRCGLFVTGVVCSLAGCAPKTLDAKKVSPGFFKDTAPGMATNVPSDALNSLTFRRNGHRTLQDLGNNKSTVEFDCDIFNESEYEIAELEIEVDLLGTDDRRLATVRRTVSDFRNYGSQFKGSLLPNSTATTRFALEVPTIALRASRYNRSRVLSAKGYLNPENLKNAGHFYALILRNDVERVKSLCNSEPGYVFIRSGTTPFIAACTIPDDDRLARFFFEYEGPAALEHDAVGLKPIHAAALSGSPALEFLVSKGADPNGFAGPMGFRPLHMACYNDNPETITRLVKLGADPKLLTQQGASTMGIAASYGRTRVIQALLDAGVPIAFRDQFGRTALHLAGNVANAHELIAFLVDKGLDLDLTDSAGMTALHVAVNEGRSFVAYSLIDAGANRTLRDNQGRTAADLAIATRQTGLAEYLR